MKVVYEQRHEDDLFGIAKVIHVLLKCAPYNETLRDIRLISKVGGYRCKIGWNIQSPNLQSRSWQCQKLFGRHTRGSLGHKADLFKMIGDDKVVRSWFKF